jgi:hypothetical protein
MNHTSVYRTVSGMIFRVTSAEDGHLSVEVLKEAAWESGPIGMVGLRRVKGTRRLTTEQIAALVD